MNFVIAALPTDVRLYREFRYCGFAALQCGKALPYRRYILVLRLRRRIYRNRALRFFACKRGIAANDISDGAVRRSLTALESGEAATHWRAAKPRRTGERQSRDALKSGTTALAEVLNWKIELLNLEES